MDIFSKAFSIFNNLVSALTLPGLLVVCAIGILACVWALLSPRGRMVFFVVAILCYVLSTSSGGGSASRNPIPQFIITIAFALKWALIIPIVIYGCFISIIGRGASIWAIGAFMILSTYILGRAVFSGSWDRYFLWILMMIGLPGLGAQACRELGIGTIFRYIFFMAYVVLGISLLQILLRPGTAWVGYRYASFLPNPNTTGALLACFIVPGLWIFFEHSRTKLILLILIILGLMLIITGSRASACQILPVLAIIVVLYSKKPIMWVSLIIAVGILLFVSTMFFADDLLARFTSTSTSGRTDLWKEYWRIGMENPLAGKGMGWIDSDNNYISMAPHNGFIFMFVEAGFVGMILTGFAYLFVVFRNSGRKYYYLFPQRRQVRWFVFAQLIGFLISGFFESWFIGVGYFEFPMFLFMIGVKDELDREVCIAGEQYWDESLLVNYGFTGSLAYC